MKISKEAILDKTFYGIHIYSYILRRYYPTDTVLSLSGGVCMPTKNPFNENKPSLMVSIVNNLAKHADSDNSIPQGDVFDFAQLHFKKEGNELLEVINEELHLKIGEVKSFYKKKKESTPHWTGEKAPAVRPKIKIPQFSYFEAPISNIYPSSNLSLIDTYELIKSEKYRASTEQLRAIQIKDGARKLKASKFDYVTFSGTFSKRNDKELLNHSGLLTIDFDHLTNLQQLKNQLLKDEYFETELLFISPSGDGLKWIIPIDTTESTHQNFFTAIANYIRETYHLEVDKSGKDISRACFLPFDPEVYINPKYLEQ